MLDPSEYDDIVVTVLHPWGNGYPTLNEWIATGPGPRRMVEIVAAKRRSTGEPVPMREIPLEYHNSYKSREMQRAGKLPAPWGMPPDEHPPPPMPEHIRRLVEDD